RFFHELDDRQGVFRIYDSFGEGHFGPTEVTFLALDKNIMVAEHHCCPDLLPIFRDDHPAINWKAFWPVLRLSRQCSIQGHFVVSSPCLYTTVESCNGSEIACFGKANVHDRCIDRLLCNL